MVFGGFLWVLVGGTKNGILVNFLHDFWLIFEKNLHFFSKSVKNVLKYSEKLIFTILPGR